MPFDHPLCYLFFCILHKSHTPIHRTYFRRDNAIMVHKDPQVKRVLRVESGRWLKPQHHYAFGSTRNVLHIIGIDNDDRFVWQRIVQNNWIYQISNVLLVIPMQLQRYILIKRILCNVNCVLATVMIHSKKAINCVHLSGFYSQTLFDCTLSLVSKLLQKVHFQLFGCNW